MKFALVLILNSLSFSLWSQTDHWESVILEGAEFRYTLPIQEPTGDWTDLSFDDSDWQLGNSGFGYGDGDDATVIPTTTAVYLRKPFTIIDLTAIEQILLHMDYDDGFVAYLNGSEVARAHVSGSPPAFNQTSDDLHEALLYQGGLPEVFNIDKSFLNSGENILTVQVHNSDINSSDLTAIPVLSLGISNSSNNYLEVPDWFTIPVNFTSTNLPIVIINTEGGQNILDESKILADMKIVYRDNGERTYLTDQDNEEYIDFDGKIKIEIRGSSSQSLPKKQYGFKTYDQTGEDKINVKLLGMPKENNWILNGLAFDPSLMRDYIAYNLSRRIGEYASRTQYCEVVLNGIYNGLYILQEKIKQDDNRINVTPVGDNEDGSITGGYITKSDKTDDDDPIAWSMANYIDGATNFVHVEPDPVDITTSQNTYIKEQFELLQSTVSNSNSSKIDGYPSVIDIPSFINFIILNELASNVDAYEFSTYFHKDKNGKLRAGPIWDFNLTFGNDLFLWGFDRSFTDVWQFDDGENVGAKFWKDLFEDEVFKCYLSKRWHELTVEGQPLHPNSILAFIDETDLLITEAVEREQQTWETVTDHNQNIANMKIWVTERIRWMNEQMGSFSACADIVTSPLVISKINYHSNSEEFGDISEQEFIEITNNGTTEVDLSGIYFGGTGFVYQFPANSHLLAGDSIQLVNDAITFNAKYGRFPFGEFTRSLSNNSEQLLLLDAFGNVIDEVTYDDKNPWPEEADGDGYYLQLNDLNADNNDPINWRAVTDNLSELVSQEIIIEPILDQFLSTKEVEIIAISSSGLDLELSIVGPGILSGDIIELDGTAGIITITANQSGNETYSVAAEQSTSFEVYDPCADFKLEILSVTNVLSGLDGAIDIQVTGGTEPYAYSWSNGATTEDLIGIDPGIYALVVSDDNNCLRTVVAGDVILGVEEIGSSLSFNYYPIPAQEKLSIEFKNKSFADVSIQIRDLQGRLLISETYENRDVNNRKININLNKLPSGGYILMLETNDNKEVGHLIIEH